MTNFIILTNLLFTLCYSDIDYKCDCDEINAGSANDTATTVSFLLKFSHLIGIKYNRIIFYFYKFKTTYE
jgi:hypothetical protein